MRNRQVFTILMVALSFLVFRPASAGTKIELEVQYYDIKGSSVAELLAQMHELGPTDNNDGMKVQALTWYEINWQYNYGRRGSRCSIAEVSLSTRVVYLLPNWTNRDEADEELKARWDTYIDRLSYHEQGHARIAFRVAKQIHDAIIALPPQKSCQTLGRVANALGKRIIDEDRQDEDYDQENGHGSRQGVTL